MSSIIAMETHMQISIAEQDRSQKKLSLVIYNNAHEYINCPIGKKEQMKTVLRM